MAQKHTGIFWGEERFTFMRMYSATIPLFRLHSQSDQQNSEKSNLYRVTPKNNARR